MKLKYHVFNMCSWKWAAFLSCKENTTRVKSFGSFFFFLVWVLFCFGLGPFFCFVFETASVKILIWFKQLQ